MPKSPSVPIGEPGHSPWTTCPAPEHRRKGFRNRRLSRGDAPWTGPIAECHQRFEIEWSILAMIRLRSATSRLMSAPPNDRYMNARWPSRALLTVPDRRGAPSRSHRMLVLRIEERNKQICSAVILDGSVLVHVERRRLVPMPKTCADGRQRRPLCTQIRLLIRRATPIVQRVRPGPYGQLCSTAMSSQLPLSRPCPPN